MKVLMPQIGMTMTEGTINEWKVNDGAHVEKGEIIMEIETEKLTNDIESPATGTIKIIVPAGEDAKCGEEIAEIIED